MTRYSHLKWMAPVAALATAVVIAISAAPTGATLVCPKGVKPPSSYCTNVPPTATTGKATKVKATSATLNGVAGPDVAGGDITRYFFQYGKTKAYGSQKPRPPGTIGSCPSGITTPSPYCNVPKTKSVSAKISKLASCTTYHFRLVATNADGTTNGGDKKFTTKFAHPLKKVKAPNKVKARHKFQVQFTLTDQAKVKIVIKHKKGGVVVSHNYGTLRSGKHTKTLTAPRARGKYILEVIAKQSCGSQTVTGPLTVH
jgi:hypothetical protein